MAAAVTFGVFALAFVLAARMGRWFLFQTMIFSAVLCAAIYFRWSIDGYAASIVAYVTAFIATRAVAVVAAAVAVANSQYRRARPPLSQPKVITMAQQVSGLQQPARG